MAYKCARCHNGVENPVLDRLLEFMGMQDGGAFIPFDYLQPIEWIMLGALKHERERLTIEANKENHGNGQNSSKG